jgi:hypothetical protein
VGEDERELRFAVMSGKENRVLFVCLLCETFDHEADKREKEPDFFSLWVWKPGRLTIGPGHKRPKQQYSSPICSFEFG